MNDDKELAYKLIAKYGREWLKEDRGAIYEMEKSLKTFPKAMREPYEDAIKKDKDFLFQVAEILREQDS